MLPVLIKLGSIEVHTYAVTIVLGFVSAIWLANRRVEPAGYQLRDAQTVQTILILSSIAGGRLVFVALEWPQFRDKPWEVFFLWKGGLVFYGGLLAAIAGSVIYGWVRRLPVLPGLDVAAPSIAIGQVFGRLGCFASGCCYGTVTQMPWGMTFPATAHDSLPRHPAQLYEFLALLVIAVALNWYYGRPGRSRGLVLIGYCYSYGIARFLIEFLRGDDRGGFFFGVLSVSQLISIGVVLAALPLHVYCLRAARRGMAD